MPSTIRHLTIDCRDPFALARFWADVLGFADDPEDPNAARRPRGPDRRPPGPPPRPAVPPRPRAQGRQEPPPPRSRPRPPPRRRGRPPARARGHPGRRPAQRRRHRLGGAGRSRGQRVLRRAVGRPSGASPQPSDTGLRACPSAPAPSDEREMLEQMLDWYRGPAWSARSIGVDATRWPRPSPLRSGIAIAGLVKHLALVEDSWFADRLRRPPGARAGTRRSTGSRPDWEFHTADDEPLALQVERYQAACQRGREIAAGHELDDIGADTVAPRVHPAVRLRPPDRGDRPAPGPPRRAPRAARRHHRRVAPERRSVRRPGRAR